MVHLTENNSLPEEWYKNYELTPEAHVARTKYQLCQLHKYNDDNRNYLDKHWGDKTEGSFLCNLDQLIQAAEDINLSYVNKPDYNPMYIDSQHKIERGREWREWDHPVAPVVELLLRETNTPVSYIMINKIPKIIVTVHLGGNPSDLNSLKKLSKKYKFKIIEDASHSFGGKYYSRKVGCSKWSDITVFSFHPVKIITTGEGGAVTTNNIDIFQKVRILRSHGITKDKECFINKNEGDWYYEQQYLGFNYRLTDLQAALGVSQIKRTKEFISKRREISRRYNELLNGLPIITPKQENYSLSSWHLYVIRIKSNLSKKSHDEIFHTLREKNILVNLHYIPIHLQPFYKKLGFKKGDFPKAEKYYREAISLPIYYSLSFEEQDYVINTLKNILT